MIARIWHGVTLASKADDYLTFLNRAAIEDYQSPGGNRGIYIMRRFEGDQAHFLLISFWEDRAALVRYAGPDIEKAQYYPEDKEFLIELEPNVVHYEIMTSA